MPELPEVETVKRTLKKLILNETIKDVRVSWPKIIKEPDDIDEFRLKLIGQTFHDIKRRGKFLVFLLDDYALISHLRMEGRYGIFSEDEEPDKHTHVRFILESNKELRYRDVRKFGTMHLFPKGEEYNHLPLIQLGVEPFSNEFTPERLYHLLNKTTRNIKATLLDQTYVVGLGNIYVDEALFRANIHPEVASNELNTNDVKKLHKSIVDTLEEAVNMGGSSIKTYVNGQGEMGMFQQTLYVYGRKGMECKVCGDEIVKNVVSGRGTHTCPSCQKVRNH
ncbi:DNA-formamidopyrimidine glycosylase [Evansella cellulosilytica]|uniref:Formamidopyrimidine-DNA glycosylase n=1 Tax=Evansella cellulosilytica (strain ATCC 21833 / DSM 2522 / FERM P-1141 / JCM 9156 / N-4) TaxID=649639 RepID=E6U0L0_EVAC2|nr:DNA-formamidopyrimidine glycosylase [Evansella cellulosilytica]ADU31455.1 formamidopyrimidine-DNA glycosylase [Evansella cellulosilytica DSM 2522]